MSKNADFHRLTFEENGNVGVSGMNAKNQDQLLIRCIQRLAAYEDTGVEPSEVAHLRKQLHGYVEQCLHYEKQLKAYSSLGSIEGLSELIRAIEIKDCMNCFDRGCQEYRNETAGGCPGWKGCEEAKAALKEMDE